MDCIYTITTLYNQEIPKCRCVGYYFDLDVAIKAVLNNDCDIYEFSYKYCVIEKVKQGLYYFPRDQFWFQWDHEKEGYVQLKEKPNLFKRIGGFGIG